MGMARPTNRQTFKIFKANMQLPLKKLIDSDAECARVRLIGNSNPIDPPQRTPVSSPSRDPRRRLTTRWAHISARAGDSARRPQIHPLANEKVADGEKYAAAK
jgi:hypothetical protein